jgi:hypothetical protein
MIITGYAAMGPVSAGPIATFLSFNRVEGLNLRMGMESNLNLSKKFQLQGYLARAVRTELWKYSGGVTYSFNEDYVLNPRHYLKFNIERESSFPGQELEFFSPSNFFLSFQRGDATKMLLNKTFELTYVREFNGFSYHLDLRRKERLPYGSLEFNSFDSEGQELLLDNITTAEATIGIRYAPNEQFLQGKKYRTQLPNQYPIITLNYTHGHSGILGGQFNYNKLKLNVFKQIEWLTIGTTNMVFDAGKTWGDVPYILQEIPRGNQTYAYQLTSYNMMNFMEFVTDQFVSFNAEHYFFGYFLNRIPIIRGLKLREIVSFKAYYGSLADRHNPNLDPTILQFPVDANGNPTTFLLGSEPYMEASIGFSNILKVFRVDLVQRLNYLDQPNVPALFGNKGLGVRVRTLVEF